jgi:hypothetical protein
MLCDRDQIDFSRLDKDQSFLGHVINQIMGKKSYLPHPPHILPYIFDFLSVLAIIRKHLPGVRIAAAPFPWRECVSCLCRVSCVCRVYASCDLTQFPFDV